MADTATIGPNPLNYGVSFGNPEADPGFLEFGALLRLRHQSLIAAGKTPSPWLVSVFVDAQAQAQARGLDSEWNAKRSEILAEIAALIA